MKVFSHKPEGYECPFCRVVSGIERPIKGTKQRDIIYQNEYVTAFIASKWWENNKGHVLVVPNQHFENIYELPKEYAAEIHHAAQLTAFAMKSTYGCDGISTRQHNEPAGNQDVGITIFMFIQGMKMISFFFQRIIRPIQKNALSMRKVTFLDTGERLTFRGTIEMDTVPR